MRSPSTMSSPWCTADVEVQPGGRHVADAARAASTACADGREEPDEAVAQADAGDDGAAVGDDRAGDRPLGQPGAGAVVGGAELLGEAGRVDDVGEEDDRRRVRPRSARPRPRWCGAAELRGARRPPAPGRARGRSATACVEQRERGARLAAAQQDHREVGLGAGDLGRGAAARRPTAMARRSVSIAPSSSPRRSLRDAEVTGRERWRCHR